MKKTFFLFHILFSCLLSNANGNPEPPKSPVVLIPNYGYGFGNVSTVPDRWIRENVFDETSKIGKFRATNTFYLPVYSTPSLKGGKDSLGAVMYVSTANHREMYVYNGVTWKRIPTINDVDSMNAARGLTYVKYDDSSAWHSQVVNLNNIKLNKTDTLHMTYTTPLKRQGNNLSITGAALSKVDDTNVTLTLGGTPLTALLQATSLTLGWTGTLADARIASAATWNAKQAAVSAGNGWLLNSNTGYADTTKLPSLHGNAWGDGMFNGSTNNRSIRWRTNNIERMHLDSSGRGLFTPTIVGGTGVTSNLTFLSTTGVGSSTYGFHFRGRNNGNVEYLTIGDNATNSICVGIANTTPTYRLDINTESVVNGGIRVMGSSNPTLDFRNSSTNNYGVLKLVTTSYNFTSTDDIILFTTATGNIYFSTDAAANPLLSLLKANGNVGIRTQTPVSQFHIGVNPTASANYGLVSLGAGNYSGTGSQYFTGAAGGTFIGINAAANTASNFIDLQRKGTSVAKVDSIGNGTFANILSGTYTPTLSNSTNVTASTARQCTYLRVGNSVTVSGQFDIDPTLAATATVLGISLPVASNFSTVYQAGGGAWSTAVVSESAGVQANGTTDVAEVTFICTDATNHTMSFTFTYQIL